MSDGDVTRRALDGARALWLRGEDEAAKAAYVDVLRLAPTHFSALNELGALAAATGHRSAAHSVYARAVEWHPGNPLGRFNFANLLVEDGDLSGARAHYEAALAIDLDFPEAHQGLARLLAETDDAAADAHWERGFAGHSIVARPYRGAGQAPRLLLLVSARGGNIPTRHWIDDRRFAVTAVYADYHDPAEPLPPHDLVVNAIGDADLCGVALANAQALLARCTVPVLNPPARVQATGRAENARRAASLPGVRAPRITALSRAAILDADGAVAEAFAFPVLLRAPGFHTGRHFGFAATPAALAKQAAAMHADALLAIEYVDARPPDGLARKYRVMFIDGVLYPMHLAISSDWKVHYFSAAMAESAAHRDEERRFLDDMPGVLGERAMAALAGIAAMLGLDYAGVDFAVAPDGSVLFFEANATMVINPPEHDPMWDYRRPAAAVALAAAQSMLERRAYSAAAANPPDCRSQSRA